MATKKFTCTGAKPYNRGSFIMPEFGHRKITKGETFDVEEQQLDMFLAKYGHCFVAGDKAEKKMPEGKNKKLPEGNNKKAVVEDLI